MLKYNILKTNCLLNSNNCNNFALNNTKNLILTMKNSSFEVKIHNLLTEKIIKQIFERQNKDAIESFVQKSPLILT